MLGSKAGFHLVGVSLQAGLTPHDSTQHTCCCVAMCTVDGQRRGDLNKRVVRCHDVWHQQRSQHAHTRDDGHAREGKGKEKCRGDEDREGGGGLGAVVLQGFEEGEGRGKALEDKVGGCSGGELRWNTVQARGRSQCSSAVYVRGVWSAGGGTGCCIGQRF